MRVVGKMQMFVQPTAGVAAACLLVNRVSACQFAFLVRCFVGLYSRQGDQSKMA